MSFHPEAPGTGEGRARIWDTSWDRLERDIEGRTHLRKLTHERERKERERKGQEKKGTEKKGKEREGKSRKGKERNAKDRKRKERKGRKGR